MSNAKQTIETGKAVLGIEFGSTRIKAVLVNETGEPIASGAHDWENRLENNIWTYTLEDIWTGLQDSYKKMTEDVKEKYGVEVKKLLWQISRGCKGKIRYGDHITRSDRIFRNDAWLYGI